MKTTLKLLSIASLMALTHTAHADWIDDAVLKNDAQVIQLRQHIHQHPELGNLEFETSKLVQKELKSYGIEVKTGYAKTGVIGILKGAKAGPVMAVRADMDALPMAEKTGLPFASKAKSTYQGKETEVMHACGHDAHTAMLLGAAKILAEHKEQLAGTVVFVFQPAEEGGADIDNFSQSASIGARKMMSDGALNNPKPEVMFGQHVMANMRSGEYAYKAGAALNSADGFQVTVTGKQVHGSMPWAGRDPIVAAANMIAQAQTLVSRRADISKGMGLVSFGNIHGGTAENIIPETVTMAGTIRSNHPDIRNALVQGLPEVLNNVAKANGVQVEVKQAAYAPVTMNEPKLTEVMAASLQKASGGKAHVLATNQAPSEDFAFYAEKIPSLYVFLGATPAGQDLSKAAPNHSPEFTVDNATLKTGVNGLVRMVLDYPQYRDAVQASWRSAQS
ncbi:amidohydrolase [Vitreoscilla massiliensis]|uniref:Amidohydrolase n=1 Tax=Vitreoscilla massiliensis TaxID=1689272 RepID=A0ABY4E392_9NEIS|nr:amidohydrolase [Vitreoscilla massiliensis]UOO89855.1 amidohydrolase [Vitreoscilla massiliensis]